MKHIKFDNGDTMPIFGLGTWKSRPGDVYRAVQEAVRLGYTHIDCAPIYGNEAEVGNGLAELFTEGVVRREDIRVTSKLWNNAHAAEAVRPALQKTLQDLRLDYLDLFLIHWPIAFKEDVIFHKNAEDMVSLEDIPLAETWSAMEDLVAEGLCRHIGVSNFSIDKLRALAEVARRRPEMNQIELHPYLQQPAMLEYCKQNNIFLTAYAPLGSADRPSALKDKGEPRLLDDPVVTSIAKRHDATPAQVLISWAIHRNTVVIPKSVDPHRLKQNLQAVDLVLTENDMREIGNLDRHYRYVSGNFWVVEGGPYSLENIWDE